jgi:hypothetical protein
MHYSEIIDDSVEITPEIIKSLSLKNSIIVAKQLFEIEDVDLKKDQLHDKMIEILENQKPALDPIEQQKQIIHNFVSNKENREAALQIGKDIRSIIGRKWFTALDLHYTLKQIRLKNEHYFQSILRTPISAEEREEAQKQLNGLLEKSVESIVELKSRLEQINLFGFIRKRSTKKSVEYRINSDIIDRQIRSMLVKDSIEEAKQNQ